MPALAQMAPDGGGAGAVAKFENEVGNASWLGRDAVARTSIPPALGLKRGHRVRRKVPSCEGSSIVAQRHSDATVLAVCAPTTEKTRLTRSQAGGVQGGIRRRGEPLELKERGLM